MEREGETALEGLGKSLHTPEVFTCPVSPEGNNRGQALPSPPILVGFKYNQSEQTGSYLIC